jgi:hypothetical protein
MSDISVVREYRPLLASRRGEGLAWLSAGLVTLVWLALWLTNQPVYVLIPLAQSGFLLAAFLISLGNWVDRRTIILLDETGIRYKNGLRKVNLPWDQVLQVQVQPMSWGKRIQVKGDHGMFSFRTLAEVNMLGKLQGRFGFEKGDEILRQIVLNSGLRISEQSGEIYLYARP